MRTTMVLLAGLLSTAELLAEPFTLVQTTPLTGTTSACGLEFHVATDRFYVFDGAATSNQLHVFNRAGTHLSAFSPGWAGQNFSQGGIDTDPVSGELLVLRDLNPPIPGPGTQVYRVNPVTTSGVLDVDLDPVTIGEVSSLDANPFNCNLLLSEWNNVSNGSKIIEVTRTGSFVREVVTEAQMAALGGWGDNGAAIFPVTNELVFSVDAGASTGKLFAVDLQTLVIRLFFDPGGGLRMSGLTFGPTGDLATIDCFSTDNLRLYDFDGDGSFTIPHPACLTRPGDLDGDNNIDGSDISPFIACITDPLTCSNPCADMDANGTVTKNIDLSLFVAALLASDTACP